MAYVPRLDGLRSISTNFWVYCMENIEKQLDEAANKESIEKTGLPQRQYVFENFRSHSAMIRYLTLYTQDIKTISGFLGLKYRHVYNVVKKAKTEQIPDRICPVCRNRKG